MKNSTFTWSYTSELTLRSDRTMTRDKLAKMIKGWRKNGFNVSRKASNRKTLFIVRTGGLIAFSEMSK